MRRVLAWPAGQPTEWLRYAAGDMGTFPQSVVWIRGYDDQWEEHIVPHAYWNVTPEGPRDLDAHFHATRPELIPALRASQWHVKPGGRRQKTGMGIQRHQTYASKSTVGASGYFRPAHVSDPGAPEDRARGPVAMLICAARSVPPEYPEDKKQASLPVKKPGHHARYNIHLP